MANGELQNPLVIDHILDLSNSFGDYTNTTWTPNASPYTISSIQNPQFKKIIPYQYHKIEYEMIYKLVNLKLGLNIVDYDYLNNQTLAYSLEFDYIQHDEPLYFECYLNDIEYYDIIEIDKHDSRYLNFGYVKCEIVGVTGFSGLNSVLIKILDKKDLE